MRTGALIDLDADLDVDLLDASGAAPVHRHRRLGVAMSVLLLLTLAGSVPVAAPLWRRAGTAPTADASAVFAVAGDRLYVASRAEPTVTAWSLRPFRQLWSVPIPADDIDRLELYPVPGRLLLVASHSEGPSTIALDDRTGTLAWTSSGEVRPLPGARTGLVEQPEFDAEDDSELDPVQGSSSYWVPPARTILRGVNLTDGRERWSRQWRGPVAAAAGTAAAAGLVVVSVDRTAGTTVDRSQRRLELLDADTGSTNLQRVVSGVGRDRRTRPERDAVILRVTDGSPVIAQVADGLVVIGVDDADGPVGVAFGLVDLTEKWRLPDRGLGGLSTCAGVPCARRSTELAILDPTTGAVRWSAPDATDLSSRGGHAVQHEITDAALLPRRTVDLATGAPRVDLSGWPIPVQGTPDTPLLLAAPDKDGGTAFAVLRSGEQVVRLLGRSASSVAGCAADARLVACITPVGIELFEYRA